MTNTDDAQRTMTMVKVYPVGVLLVSVLLNYFAFGVNPVVVALPSVASIVALVISAALLIINHTWLMTTTELTRVRFGMYATPEEWTASRTNSQDAPEEGLRELERRHNAHRNTTENTVYFALLAGIFILISPTTLAAQIWLIGFGVARLGYTYSYLAGKDNARGLFMTLTLLAMFGIASYLVISLFA